MKTKAISGLLFAALGLAVAGPTMLRHADAQTTPERWEVEVDVFSGRANPVFTLGADEVLQMKDRWSRATPSTAALAETGTVRPNKLGYRGLVLRRVSATDGTAAAAAAPQVLAAKGAEAPVRIEVYRGAVLDRAAGQPTAVKTGGKDLERYLVGVGIEKKVLPDAIGSNLLQSLP